MRFVASLKAKTSDQMANAKSYLETGQALRATLVGAGLLLAVLLVLSALWDTEPAMFDPQRDLAAQIEKQGVRRVTGSITVATLIELSEILLTKPGGYLTNDIAPPGVWMDNVPNWEFGVLVQIRDLTRSLRNELSRSQSQSSEDPDLVAAENQFYIDNASWLIPESEDEYRKGIVALRSYLVRLGDYDETQAQFYARADNLRAWLGEVETRLGSLSQRLSNSVGKRQLQTALAGDPAAEQSTASDPEVVVKTPWTKLDDVFYEARGATWALIHILRAVEVDFRGVLENKNAVVSMEQIVRELEPTQQTLWSPVILNGSGLGLVANHSLVMASYISRANAAIIDLRRLLEQG